MIKKNPIKKPKFLSKYIGKEYTPIDNSYASCFQDGKNYSLAGVCGVPAETVTLISEPYISEAEDDFFDRISPGWNKEFWFINVKCKRGLTHKILWVTDDNYEELYGF